MLEILPLYSRSKLWFPLTWLTGFLISASTWFVTQKVQEVMGSTYSFTNEYFTKGWPYYWGVTRADGEWSYRPNSFFINMFIWYVVISIGIEIYLRMRKRR